MRKIHIRVKFECALGKMSFFVVVDCAVLFEWVAHHLTHQALEVLLSLLVKLLRRSCSGGAVRLQELRVAELRVELGVLIRLSGFEVD